MVKNYFLVTLRIIRRNLFFSFINILGLGAGIAVCLMMLLYVINEYGYEDFHKNKKNIYRVSLEGKDTGGRMVFVPPALAPALNENLAEVAATARIQMDYDAKFSVNGAEPVNEENVFFADGSLFEIFSFDFLRGNPASALSQPYAVVLDETSARKYFGGADPLNRALKYNGVLLNVTGIIKDVPQNTHFRPRILISYPTVAAMGKYPESPWTQWGDDFTYVLLKENASPAGLEGKLNVLLKQNMGEQFASRIKFILCPLSGIHWDNDLRGDIGPKGNRMYAHIFLFAALLVLLIACFNFMNLSTSRYLDRVKEVGIRKVIGATRAQLIVQFLLESLVVTFLSLIVGFLLLQLFAPRLYDYLEVKNLGLSSVVGPLVMLMAAVLIVVGVLSGSYPALFLSRFTPAESVKKKFLLTGGSFSFRQVSMVLQFAISGFLIFATLVVIKQFDYMKKRDIGMGKNDVVIVRAGSPQDIALYEVFRNELLKSPDIVSVSGAYTVPGVNSRFNMGIRQKGDAAANSIQMQALPVDYDFVNLLGLKLVLGRNLSREFPSDSASSVLVNQTAAGLLGGGNPVGRQLLMPGRTEANIIGVIEDFNVQSLQRKIAPCVLFISPRFYNVDMIRINGAAAGPALNHIRETWKKVFPNSELNLQFMSEASGKNYRVEEKTSALMSIFALLAIFVSCIGLLGYISYLANRKTKEIGIRKVVGATVGNILFLMTRQLVVWIVLSFIIALPFAYYLSLKWLDNFAYRTDIGFWLFLETILISVFISCLTVLVRTMKAALLNPVQSLRYE
ncbi:MAG: ABC transporter permease [Bacteroidota bacterium]|jgi:putative ABC transport system permease protein